MGHPDFVMSTGILISEIVTMYFYLKLFYVHVHVYAFIKENESLWLTSTVISWGFALKSILGIYRQ